MTAFVIPYETHQTTTRVWVAWWSRLTQNMALSLRVEDPQERVVARPSLGPVSSIGLEGHIGNDDEAVCLYQVAEIQGLRPATSYRLIVTSRFGQVAVGTVETLPERLPDNSAGTDANRPFTILFGSCYYEPDDPNREITAAYLRLLSTRWRPHLKILAGDQVYLDQPAPLLGRMSSSELRRWMIAKYRRTWVALQQMLQFGPNYLTSDDHEFWNDYPERPVRWVWPELHRSLQYRRDWSNEAVAHHRAIQQGANVTQLDIGNELSIFIADTRINRERDSVHFMTAEDFERLANWIRDLQQPGVLVLGQPLLTSAVGRIGENPAHYAGLVTGSAGVNVTASVIARSIADHNLPHFQQFDDLVAMLRNRCLHDLIILGGDVHFGRIARFSYKWKDIEPVYFHEVVSSGMTVLPSAKNRFQIRSDYRGAVRWFPPNSQYNALTHTQVEYLRAIPPQEADPLGSENHFMTLSFARHPSGSGLIVGIRAWLVNRPPEGNSGPARAWTEFISMDVGRPPTNGSSEDRIITHAYRDERGVIVAVANSGTVWSPRKTADVIREIRSHRVRYFTDDGSGRLKGVHVVQSRTYGTHIRSNHDDREGNNLDDLPIPQEGLTEALRARDRLRYLD